MTLIYILKLEKDKIYIGQTDDLRTTYEEHINGQICDWTKLYKPYRIERLFDFEMNKEFSDVNKITEDYMSTYGINNVRGGIYSNIELETNQIFYLENELNQKYILEDNNPEFYFQKYKDWQVHECSRQFETDFQNSACGNPENYHSIIGSDADFVARRQESYWHLLQSRIMRCVPRHMHPETALLQIFLGQAGLLIGSKRSHFQFFL